MLDTPLKEVDTITRNCAFPFHITQNFHSLQLLMRKTSRFNSNRPYLENNPFQEPIDRRGAIYQPWNNPRSSTGLIAAWLQPCLSVPSFSDKILDNPDCE